MDQRSICLFLPLKGLSARAVSNELPAVLGADAIAYSTVNKYLLRRQFTSILVEPPEELATIDIDQAILDALDHYSFSYIRGLGRFTCIPTITVYRHLTLSLGFAMKHLRWVPQTITPTPKRSMPFSQLSSCVSSGPSNIMIGSSLSPLTSNFSIFLHIMSRPGFAQKDNPLRDRGIPSNTKNNGHHCMESTEISFA
jgi:hypothetical protein